MPVGHVVIEAVAAHLALTPSGMTPTSLQNAIWETHGKFSTRAIRYAIAELIKSGRATRKGRQGPVYAVKETT